MKLSVLVATMHQKDNSLPEKMNIQTDALIGNQCDEYRVDEFTFRGNSIKYYSSAERGIGLNRNTTFMRAKSDLCLFADDDVVYNDGYGDLIIGEFMSHPDADVIVFNLICTPEERRDYIIKSFSRVRFYNCLRYGTYRICVRTEAIRKANIAFTLLFGGGAVYGSGEDTIFLSECVRKGLRVYASEKFIGSVNHGESTWFSGFNEKFFKDKGALLYKVSKPLAKPYSLYLLARHPEFRRDITFRRAYSLMKQGMKDYRT